MADAINYLSHFTRWKNWRNFPANTLSNTLKVQLAQDVKHLALYHRWIPNRNFINRIHITKQSSDTFEIVHGRYDVVSSRENFNFNLIFLFICETRFWTIGGIWVFSSYHIHRSLWCSRFFVDCMINNRFFAGFFLNLG